MVPSLQPRGCTQQGDGSGVCAGLSVAPGSRHFQTSHHPSYGSCYTFNGVWAAQHPSIAHAECQPGLGVGGVSRPAWPHPRPPPGVSLALGAKQQDLLLPTEAGIKVMIHTRDHTPFLEHRGASASARD